MPTVLIAGGTGLIGTRLSELLTQQGHNVRHLSRSVQGDSPYPTFRWDLDEGYLDPQSLEGTDYVVNLAGAGIADKPWTDKRKQIIIDSRVKGAELFAQSFQEQDYRPQAYIAGSAIGYYGDRGEQLMTEEASPGDGFLSESTILWEKSITEVAALGIRTVGIRTGVVLSTEGGALEKMLLPLRVGMSTYFGDGQQWYSWIHLDDICGIFQHAIQSDPMHGFYNGVAPEPVRNKTLAQALKEVSSGFSILMPAPAFALRTAMGEMSDVVLDSTKVSAQKIINAGFQFRFPEIKPALADLLS